MNRHVSPSRAFKARGLRGRTLYVVDIENMVGSCEPTKFDVVRTQARIQTAVRPVNGDHTVIAASHHNAASAYFGWKGPAQRLARSGKDGADVVLLEAISDIAWITRHYDRVVLASGDHIFVPAVAALKAAGVHVIIVAPDHGLSAQMRLAAGPDLVRLEATIPSSAVNLFRLKKDAA